MTEFKNRPILYSCYICGTSLTKDKMKYKAKTCSDYCSNRLAVKTRYNKEIIPSIKSQIDRKYHKKFLVETIINSDNECVLI